jgi:DNA-binding NarL/FixJ family response regulator
LVLIDTKMKQADGMDVCRRVLGDDEQIKVAVLTSYLDPDERRQACEARVGGYLLKIVDTHSLSGWIRLAVERKPT